MILALIAALAVQDAAPATSAPAPAAVPAAQIAETSWRAVPAENLLVIDTSQGRILVEMAPAVAPLHVERMRLLARQGFFDGLNFHRVIDGFMAQTGDPLGTGDGQSAYPDLTAEFTFRRGPELPFTPVSSPQGQVYGFSASLPIATQPDSMMGRTADGRVHGWGVYCPGVAGMARGDVEDSANSQFFLMRDAYPSLDKRYSVWGRVVSGLEVVRAIKVGEGAGGIVAAPTDRMTRVRVASDLPEGERPTVRILDTTSPEFRARMDAVRVARGADFSICDLDLPAQVAG